MFDTKHRNTIQAKQFADKIKASFHKEGS